MAARLTPALFAETEQGPERFWEFFGGRIRNRNTRQAYVTAAYRFADWGEAQGLPLAAVRLLHVAGYIEQLTHAYAAATVKQPLAGLRQFFDWLVVRQVIPATPAAAIRGPKHVVKTGTAARPGRCSPVQCSDGISLSEDLLREERKGGGYGTPPGGTLSSGREEHAANEARCPERGGHQFPRVQRLD